MLILDELRHIYTVDGIEVPSVSEVTRFLSKEIYGEIDKCTLDAAAMKGTMVHAATEEIDKARTTIISEEYAPYVRAYMKFLQENKTNWLLSETSVHYDYDYAGTLDRYGWVNDELSIVDFKTSSSIGKQHKALYTAAQNLYRKALEHGDFEVKHLYILHLKKDETYKLIELPIEDTLADSCLALHKAMLKKKRKVNKNG